MAAPLHVPIDPLVNLSEVLGVKFRKQKIYVISSLGM